MALTDKPWKSYFLVYDNEAIIIAGGGSQGIEPGMQFAVKTIGRQVKDPQTGIMISLPGKEIGTIEVVSTGGDTPETEYSIVRVVSGELSGDNISEYVIEEIGL